MQTPNPVKSSGGVTRKSLLVGSVITCYSSRALWEPNGETIYKC